MSADLKPDFFLLAHSHGVSLLDGMTNWREGHRKDTDGDPRYGEAFQGWFGGVMRRDPFMTDIVSGAPSLMVSTSVSKGILQSAVDAVDYFPSYEIITGPYGQGQYWAEGCRDVTDRGIEVVMEVFLRSRLQALGQAPTDQSAPAVATNKELARRLRDALGAECDEIPLDPSLRPGN